MNGGPGSTFRFGLLLPNAGHYADPERLLTLAESAEASGWDGVFLWDHLLLDRRLKLPMTDAWTVVAAILARTRRIISGPLVTPVAGRHPWKVARETVTLDRLSGGRLVLGAGLGAAGATDFAAFGDTADLAERAARVDEGLEVIERLWSGAEVTHRGPHFHLDRVTFLPTPRQRLRVPVWTALTWPLTAPGPLARAARWDGFVPMVRDPSGGLHGPGHEELAAIMAAVGDRSRDLAVVVPGTLSPNDADGARDQVARVRAAGATWWLESFDPWVRDAQDAWAWAAQGPPRL
ncbi:LLM class flavin-dependent oxidoreductase [Streptomyces tsukubensis]|uniref:LLM class flavin-dependent oxidoreductase n=1 Tax=Streptomyces tsukubensis TaxID=83656 RepID=UPI0036B33B79